jgi:hypothetical protein
MCPPQVPFSDADASDEGNSSGSPSDPSGKETFSPSPCPSGSASVGLLRTPKKKVNLHYLNMENTTSKFSMELTQPVLSVLQMNPNVIMR